MNQIVHSQMDWTKGEGPVRNGRQRLRHSDFHNTACSFKKVLSATHPEIVVISQCLLDAVGSPAPAQPPAPEESTRTTRRQAAALATDNIPAPPAAGGRVRAPRAGGRNTNQPQEDPQPLAPGPGALEPARGFAPLTFSVAPYSSRTLDPDPEAAVTYSLSARALNAHTFTVDRAVAPAASSSHQQTPRTPVRSTTNSPLQFPPQTPGRNAANRLLTQLNHQTQMAYSFQAAAWFTGFLSKR
ncbi:hypothetical protein B0H14DRAFT_2580192 [Mycena olivaceomarginata]|nr:hypothetical protein B0H14DRAFT_2580192 [Mycena olivaceomarginata]